MAASLNDSVQAAHQATAAGRWDEAERLWHEVLRLAPRHPGALAGLGAQALRRGDPESAVALLSQARAVAPRDLATLLALSVAHRQRSDAAAEREALEAALTVDPYFIPGLLAKAEWLERSGDTVGAAVTCRNIMKISPPETQWPEQFRPQMQRARALVERYAARYGAHLVSRLEGAHAQLPRAAMGRWQEAVDLMAGRAQPYLSKANQLQVPRLPAIPFFERGLFPQLAALEARTPAIQAELAGVLASMQGLKPYIELQPGEPANQWHELNRSTRWSAFHFWRSGVPEPENLARCPETAKALEAAGVVNIPGLCPNAMFSVLAPHTHIPPHHGETNARVIAHLPLIVPDKCRYRVGAELRTWTVGETLIFDDTLEHEAHNDSDEVRVVLIFDLWNPLLDDEDRRVVQTLTAAAREFRL